MLMNKVKEQIQRILNSLLSYNQILRHRPKTTTQHAFTDAITACRYLVITQPQLTIASFKATEIHSYTIRCGHNPSSLFVANSLITFYFSAGDIDSASRIFDEIRDPDVVSWTSLVSGLVKNRCFDEALVKFVGIKFVRPNSFTLVSVLSACSSLGLVEFGMSVHGYGMKSVGVSVCGGCTILDNALLDMYVRSGNNSSATNLFDEMPVRDVVSWTTMISGYNRNGIYTEAIRMFELMIDSGEIIPNEATLVSVLSALASIGSISFGRWLHNYIQENNYDVADCPFGNALLNMYAKCGDIRMAFRVFKALRQRDLVAWTAIISGMALTGHGRHAIELFSSMLCHGIQPDGMAFLSVLSACCHSGLVDDGLMFFASMSKTYMIVPQKEHYTCIVDMLGRAGRLQEAEAITRGMKVKPDCHIWGSLVHACKIHGDEERCERLEKEIGDGVVVEGAGVYALFANGFAGSGKWNCSIGVREVMRSRRVKKNVGCSWLA